MSVAYFVCLDKGNVAQECDGKLLAEVSEQLNSIATSLGLKGLDDFFGASEDMLAEYGVEDVDAGPWFDPEEGIEWFKSMIAYLRENASGLGNTADVVDELADFTEALIKAEKLGAKWHLEVDI
jgi:hypothetical protein